MLTWYNELYEATATDAAATFLARLWTPDGIIHDTSSSSKLGKREDWLIHYLQVYVLRTTSGCMKSGVVIQLALGLDSPGSWMPLVVSHHSIQRMNSGVVYRGSPFIATHGLGWAVYKGALADTDKVVLRMLYQRIVRGPV